jgi:hypothetical protein
MSNKDIINGNNSLLEDFEENQIDVKDITSSIITNPYGDITLPYDGSGDLNSFSRILEENLSSSYKIFWFFGIYEEIIKENKYISFRKLVCRMIVGAWYPVTQYKLSLGIQDRLYDLVILIHEKYNIPCDMNKNKLLEVIENIDDVEVEKKIKTLHDYVPYRLLTPFFTKELASTKDIFKKNDNKRNKFIAGLTKEDARAIYKIDVDNKIIEINDSWYKYIRDNQTIICGWMHYSLVCYLQKRNPNVPAIPFKITAPGKRDLSKATKLWKDINRDKTVSDIYTGKELTEENFSNYGNLSIDHFITWSFVLHDKLWNLAPTFKNVNSQKSNKLPDLSLYIDKFCEIQYKSFDIMQKNPKRYKRYSEGYLSIDIAANNQMKIEKDEFSKSLKANIEPLYQIATIKGMWFSRDNKIY